MPKILLVDDDPDILETLRYTFEHEGFDVVAVHDGLEALDAARREAPDVALLDVMLPGANGYEVSRFLKQDMRAGLLPPFQIVMLTARRVSSSARLDFLQTWSGADATVWKPFDLTRLLDEVRRQVRPAPAAGAVPGEIR